MSNYQITMQSLTDIKNTKVEVAEFKDMTALGIA